MNHIDEAICLCEALLMKRVKYLGVSDNVYTHDVLAADEQVRKDILMSFHKCFALYDDPECGFATLSTLNLSKSNRLLRIFDTFCAEVTGYPSPKELSGLLAQQYIKRSDIDTLLRSMAASFSALKNVEEQKSYKISTALADRLNHILENLEYWVLPDPLFTTFLWPDKDLSFSIELLELWRSLDLQDFCAARRHYVLSRLYDERQRRLFVHNAGREMRACLMQCADNQRPNGFPKVVRLTLRNLNSRYFRDLSAFDSELLKKFRDLIEELRHRPRLNSCQESSVSNGHVMDGQWNDLMQVYPDPESLVLALDNELSRRDTLDRLRKDKLMSRMSGSRLLQKRPVIRLFDENEHCYRTELEDDPQSQTLMQDPVIALPEHEDKQEDPELSAPIWQEDQEPELMHA